MTSTLTPKRGEVWLVNFGPAVGAEIRKVRPGVILTAQGVGRLVLEIVAPLTDWKPAYAGFSWFVHVPIDPANGLRKDSGADAFQVKSLSRERFVRRLGSLTAQQVEAVAHAVAICVGSP